MWKTLRRKLIMNYYRTKTDLAGAWDEDHDAIEQLYKWNENDFYSFEFKNVHDYTQSRDSSLACSIKGSLSDRMDRCKMFSPSLFSLL